MRWLQFKIKTTTEAEDLLISELYDAGYEGAQIEDHIQLTPLEKEQMFVDILPETGEDDGTALVSVYVEVPEAADGTAEEPSTAGEEPGFSEKTAGEDGSDELAALKEKHLLAIRKVVEATRDYGIDLGDGSISVSETEDLDWINNWKKYFHQFTIDDLLVIPSWEEVKPEDKDKMILHIDPGTAFGTGMHETTQLCIRQLRRYITPESRLLDVGTGSGILGILSLMYGAAAVTGTDLDPCAVAAVEDNLSKNGVDAGRFRLIIGNIIDNADVQKKAGDGYDIAVANILANVLVPLTPEIPKHLKKGGIFITSGIIEGKEEEVSEAMRSAGFTVIDTTAQGEWRCVVGRLD